MDWKLELVIVPVSDVDRSKEFYTEKVGFALDVDHRVSDEFRVVQMTPRGSSCSISVGIGLSDMAPGSIKGLHLVVHDIAEAHRELTKRGVEISEIRHLSPQGWESGVDPEHTNYNSFADFSDPDGNVWVLQEVRR